MRTRLVSPPCLGIVYAVFKRGAACLCGGRGALRPDYLRRVGWRGRMRWEVPVCWSVGRAGAVARLPRAANRRWCGRCELSRCGVCRACALCSWGRARAAQTVAGRSGERAWGWHAMAGRTYARRIQSETGDRGWRHQVARIAARTFSMRLRRVIWLGRPGCTRSPRRALPATKVS